MFLCIPCFLNGVKSARPLCRPGVDFLILLCRPVANFLFGAVCSRWYRTSYLLSMASMVSMAFDPAAKRVPYSDKSCLVRLESPINTSPLRYSFLLGLTVPFRLFPNIRTAVAVSFYKYHAMIAPRGVPPAMSIRFLFIRTVCRVSPIWAKFGPEMGPFMSALGQVLKWNGRKYVA